jgi:hypothetical protein
MPPYRIRCYGCGQTALYKIAARWSDGVTQELKTYGLACDNCLAEWYERSRQRHAACRLAAGETLDPPGIFELTRGLRDRELKRRTELEERLSAGLMGRAGHLNPT